MVHPRLRPIRGATFLRFALRRAGAAIAALALAAGLSAAMAPAGWAQSEESFTVRGVEVDVTADNAVAARDQALVAGQRKAFDQLLLTLATAEDVARLPPLGDDAIGDMVLDFQVESESVSTVRYIGEFAFRFRAAPVQQYLERGGATYAVGATRPALVLPVLTRDGQSLLWDEGNDWLAAWSQSSVDGTLVSFVVPLGDLTDLGAVDAARALDGDAAALQAIATRYGAGDVIVAEARSSVDTATDEARVDLHATRYTPAGPDDSLQDSLSAAGGAAALPDLYRQATQRVSSFLQAQWKQENLVSSTVEQRLAVVAPLDSLNSWIDLRRRLGDIPVIRRADLLALSRGEARLDLVFFGDQAQLARALAQRDLTLTPRATVPAPQTAGPVATGPATTGPITTGSVTVDPTAVAPQPQTQAQPVAEMLWELRRGGRSLPGTAPAIPSAAAGSSAAPAADPAIDPDASGQPATIVE